VSPVASLHRQTAGRRRIGQTFSPSKSHDQMSHPRYKIKPAHQRNKENSVLYSIICYTINMSWNQSGMQRQTQFVAWVEKPKEFKKKTFRELCSIWSTVQVAQHEGHISNETTTNSCLFNSGKCWPTILPRNVHTLENDLK
jgi:hypothetical protein